MPSKLTFKKQEIFANDKVGDPTGYISQFGSYKSGAVAYSADPDVIQGFTGATGITGLTGQNAWVNGLAASVDSDKVVTLQDMNAFMFVASRQIAYNQRSCFHPYSSTITYHAFSYVIDSDGSVYMSLASDNVGNALSDTTKWKIVYSTYQRTISDNHTIAYNDYFVFWSGTPNDGVNNTITFPAADAKFVGREVIIAAKTTNSVAVNVVNVTGVSFIYGVNPRMYRIKCLYNGSSWIWRLA